jgi:hypothetical protein
MRRKVPRRVRDLIAPRRPPFWVPTVAPGDIVVADPFASAVIRLSPRTGAQGLLYWNGTVSPWSVAVTPTRQVVVGVQSIADAPTELLEVVLGTSGGTVRARFPAPRVIHGVAVGPQGSLIVSVTGFGGVSDDAIYLVDARSNRTLLVKHETIPIVLDPSGAMFVSSGTERTPAILRYDPVQPRRGLPVFRSDPVVVSQGDHLRPWIGGLALVGGSLYATVPEAGPGGRVVRVDPSTGAQSVVASGSRGGLLSRPFGIAGTASGNLVVVNYHGRAGAPPGTVVSIHPRSGSQTLLGSGGYLRQPFAVAVVPA